MTALRQIADGFMMRDSDAAALQQSALSLMCRAVAMRIIPQQNIVRPAVAPHAF